MNLTVLGAGAWGTALAIALGAKLRVTLWCRDPAQHRTLAHERVNARYLPGVPIPDSVELAADAPAALSGADLVVVAVPISGLRETLKLAARHSPHAGVVWLCKGFEAGSAKFPHQVALEELGKGARCAALSGPSFADEVARGLPAAVTLASADGSFAVDAARALHTERFRVYSSEDLPGVETGGAVKNVIAIAAGTCDGLKLGNSARAALISRGLAEMTRLGLRLGGRLETFMGLSGVGDLFLTATSDLSRNRRVGLGLGAGRNLTDILEGLGHVAEGVSTAAEVFRISERLDVEMPITAAVQGMLAGRLSAQDALRELMGRQPRHESVR
jgi:glycerol-3-phosphate dehydrogenase (NAD(P)+)